MAQRSRRSAPPRPARQPPPVARTSPAQLIAVRERVRDLIQPVLAEAGYDLEDLAIRQIGRRHQLRVTVDGDGGVSLDTVADLSRAIADALDEAEESGQEVIAGEYQLEVSSPGVDRPLTLPRHWRRAAGRLVSVKVRDGAQVIGRVIAGGETAVTLEIAEKKTVRTETFPLADLGPGHVQIEFSRLDEISDDDLEEIAGAEDAEDADTDEDQDADEDDDVEEQ